MALLERPGEIVTREDLRERLWKSDTFVDFEHGLNTAVKKARRRLAIPLRRRNSSKRSPGGATGSSGASSHADVRTTPSEFRCRERHATDGPSELIEEHSSAGSVECGRVLLLAGAVAAWLPLPRADAAGARGHAARGLV